MEAKIDAKIKQLLDFESLATKYGESLAHALDHWLSIEEAHKHGESPFMGDMLINLKQKHVQNQEEYIKYQPLFEIARSEALIQMIIENNRQLINLMGDLVTQKP